MKMPSQEEQTIAEKYVMERPLPRPDTDIKKAVISVLIFLSVSFVICFALRRLFCWLGISSLFPPEFQTWLQLHPSLSVFLFYLAFYLLFALIAARKAAIGAIRLYQHYAPEDIRRRCLFKPTCSEYAILAIQKYGLIIGGIKSYDRLVKRCRGNIYMIDYPWDRPKRP